MKYLLAVLLIPAAQMAFAAAFILLGTIACASSLLRRVVAKK